MAFAGMIPADLLGAGLDILGTKMQQKSSYKYAKKLALNQYPWARQSLERAGLNPMLALGGHMPTMPPMANPLQGFAESARGFMHRGAELKQAQWALASAEQGRAQSRAQESAEWAQSYLAQQHRTSAQQRLEFDQKLGWPAEIAQANANIAASNAMAEQARAHAAMLRAETPQAQARGDVYSGPLGRILAYGREVGAALPPFILNLRRSGAGGNVGFPTQGRRGSAARSTFP